MYGESPSDMLPLHTLLADKKNEFGCNTKRKVEGIFFRERALNRGRNVFADS